MSDLTIQFTKGDLLSGTMMDAGWKVAELTTLFEDSSKSGKEGYVGDFKIVAPAKYADVEVRCWYFDKMGMAALSRLLGAAAGVEIKPGTAYNAKSIIGRKVKIYTEQKTNPNNGTPMNQIGDYAVLDDTRAVVRE